MYNVNSQRVNDYKSTIYLCKKLPSIIDDYGNEVVQYDKPQKMRLNVSYLSQEASQKEFGIVSKINRVITITEKTKYINTFSEFDVMYIDVKPSPDEINFGLNADYRVYAIRPQNCTIKVYLEKLIK